MNIDGTHYRTIWIDPNNRLLAIDQRFLPHELVIVHLQTFTQICEAITTMVVRGAGLIGATAGYGMWVAATEWHAKSIAEGLTEGRTKSLTDDLVHISFDTAMHQAGHALKKTRPTAANLAVAVDRQLAAMAHMNTIATKLDQMRCIAENIANEDADFCKRIGEHGLALIESLAKHKKATRANPVHILTHCNAGWLAFVDFGSALAPIYAAHDAGLPIHVWVDETRPRNQGASLTAWELLQHGVPHSLVADNAGGHLMQHGLVDMVITGADRVTRHGDVANKIGTYLKALAAYDNNVPFYVALPSSTFDFAMGDGVREIPIEERNPDEVRYMSGKAPDGSVIPVQICPDGTLARNWAFDVTPARLITGLLCERGLCDAREQAILELFPLATQVPHKHSQGHFLEHAPAPLPQDGMIKYTADHMFNATSPLLHSQEAHVAIATLDAARTQLHDAGLVGCTPQGLGFGNLSHRFADQSFVITGSGTGALRVLGNTGYCLVHETDPQKNRVVSEGPVQASSESMTHGVIYAACPQARCVIHVHSKALFTALLARDWPHTPAHSAYGTPALAWEVTRLLQNHAAPQGVFVTAGHDSGIFAYGESLSQTLHALMDLLRQHDLLPTV